MKRSTRLIALVSIALVLSTIANAEPLHVYLTYSGAPETSIDVNVITPERLPAVRVHYDTVSRDGKPERYAHHADAQYHKTLIELSDERAVYAAQLTGLNPGTIYYFVTEDEKTGLSRERKFRTLPGGDAPFRFVDGGDMGVDGLVVPLLKLAGKADPDFGLIGGDIAYVNGLLAGNRTWDRWLKNWDSYMVTSDGRTIPIVTAIGNHETNDFKSDDLEMQSPWYIGLFGRQAPNVYHSLRVGNNAVFFMLDTGHLSTYDGAQATWLDAELSRYRDVPFKFAAYHVPLYPAHREYEGDDSQSGRKFWAPLFDTYGLTVAFEHHDHVFKRSKPLKGGQVADGGTVYLGDGCFGRAPRTINPQPRWYNEIEKSAAHFWLVDVAKDGVKFQAIDDQSQTLDRFSLP